ncbi:UNVERIFIED_CONTAM: hypothetical protein NCL1_07270 [Trichonephila clavipes]
MTDVSMLTVDTVTNSKNAVSTIEHRGMRWHRNTLMPNGMRRLALLLLPVKLYSFPEVLCT